MNLITLKNIDKAFISNIENITLLQNINLTIQKNKIISIVGNSGSGKTTLLNIIAGIENHSSGEVHREDHLKINYVTQYPHFIDELSIYDNLIFASLKNINEEQIKRYLTLFQCENLINKKPRHLSGGEKQRINIIRSLLANPDIIILDEPTASLDYDNKMKIVSFLNTLYTEEKLTIILVTHDKEILNHFPNNNVYELKNKTLTYQST